MNLLKSALALAHPELNIDDIFTQCYAGTDNHEVTAELQRIYGSSYSRVPTTLIE